MTKGKRRARKVQVHGLGFDSEIEAPRWETVRTVDLLALDDFGAQSDTAWAREKIYQLVNYRVSLTHGSWLSIAEIEFSALGRQCLAQRIPDEDQLADHVQAWTDRRNTHGHTVNWQFTAADARIKLNKLYPSIDN